MSIDVRILETAIIFAEDIIIFSMNLLISYHTNLTNKMVIVERSKFNLECIHKRIFSMYGIWESYNLHFFRISECTYVVPIIYRNYGRKKFRGQKHISKWTESSGEFF